MRTRGYDNLDVNQELLLDLQFQEGTGAVTADWAKPHHAFTLSGAPTWQNLANDLTYLDFVSTNPDFLPCAAPGCTDLDFTTGDFSGACWLRADGLGNRNILTHGVHNADGWYWYIYTDGSMWLVTSQAGANQHSAGGTTDIVIGTWRFVGFSRDGASVRMFANGQDVTNVEGTHVDPVTAGARNFYIGANNGAVAAWYDGDMWRPRIWGRALEAEDFVQLFEQERHLFGV